MTSSEFTYEEEQMIEREFQSLLSDYANTPHRQKVEIITKAFQFANKAHHGVRRLSGEPYMMHPLSVARIVVKEIGLGSTSICAALLHDVVEDTDYTTDDIRSLFGDKIAQIVDGLTKISGGVFGEHASEQAENFRKLLLTMSDDIRVVLIKIADRLHNMRTLGSQPKEKQYKIAGETLYIYAPLAHRLGLFSIKSELEDLSFRYEQPEEYEEIAAKLRADHSARMENYEVFVAPIRERLMMLGYQFELSARIKSVYSIKKKMVTKNIPFEDVYDILAVRIIFEPNQSMSEKDQCWMIYSAITEIYRPHPERIRDWISTPKANGYEALHVTVMGQDGQWVEIQIRTRRMHEIAEHGLAAHWKYKTGTQDETELDKWLQDIKDILANPTSDAVDFLDTFKLNLFAHEVFVFTPKGDVKTLPLGATVLDLAYHLHSELGEHCIGAKVNHSLQPVSYVLHSGDQVEVLSSEQQEPQESWLGIVTTAKAQATLNNYFHRKERRLLKLGEQRFTQALENEELSDSRDMVLQRTLNHYHLAQPNELYLLVGKGAITLEGLKDTVFPKKSIWSRLNPFSSSPDDQQTKEEVIELTRPTPEKKSKSRKVIITDENISDMIFDSCCHPIAGDEVLGYRDDRGRMHIHHLDCPEAQKLKTKQGHDIYSVTWDTHRTTRYLQSIEIKGIDRFGLMIAMLHIITDEYRINLADLHVHADKGIFNAQLEIEIYDKEQLDEVMAALQKIDDVDVVRRL